MKGQVVTSSNKDQISAEIGKSKLPDNEKDALIGAFARSALGNYDTNGKTVQTIIGEQRQWQAQKDAEAEAAHEAQLKAEAKRKEIARQIASALSVTPISKRFSPANFMTAVESGEEMHGAEIDMQVQFHNKGKKTITAFKGALEFDNAFGDKIYGIHYDESDAIRPSESVTHDGSIHYNQFEESEQRLRDTPLSEMKSHFVAEAIVFSDGTRLVAESE